MKTLDQLQEELQNNQILIRDLEQALAARPAWADSIRLNMRSLRKLHGDLESDFEKAAKTVGTDICRYRLFADNSRPTKISGIAGALSEFQFLFSLVYEVIKSHQPKLRARVSSETTDVTSFEFGYTFSGSVGFTLVLPTELVLLGHSDFDLTIKSVFELARARSSDQIAEFAKRLGAAPIRALYRWASHHVHSGLGADIDWQSEQVEKNNLLIQVPELLQLRSIIEQTSEADEKDVPTVGRLIAADLERLTFKLKLSDDAEIAGTADPGAFKVPDGLTLDLIYRATIRRTTIIQFSTDEEKTTNRLLTLEKA